MIRRIRDDAGALHALAMPEAARAELWVLEPTAPAVVLGSAQSETAFDRRGLEVDNILLAERRTGGGAVFIEPTGVVWIDVLAPRGDPWWRDDLREQFLIVGECWQRALVGLGIGAELADRAPGRDPLARVACWAGVGWGEVVVGVTKVVGLSQRRTRWGARVQSMAVLDGSMGRVGDHLLDTADVRAVDVRAAIAAEVVGVERLALEQAVIAELESLR